MAGKYSEINVFINYILTHGWNLRAAYLFFPRNISVVFCYFKSVLNIYCTYYFRCHDVVEAR